MDALFEFGAYPLDMLLSCFGFLDGDRATDPLISGQRCQALPSGERFRVSGKGGA